jgi:hypothetical protein
MAEQVAPVRTPLAPAQALALISSALESELGRVPTDAEIKILLAQSALETGFWQKMWNWNFGNSVAAPGSPFFVLHEASVHHYRPFSSAWQGAAYFVALIRRRFARAWSLLGAGDPVAFAYALKAQNYYEAPAAAYGAHLAELYRKFGAGGSSSSSASSGRSPAELAKLRNDGSTGSFGAPLALFLTWYWWRSRQLRY